jgi:hypothetical protein
MDPADNPDRPKTTIKISPKYYYFKAWTKRSPTQACISFLHPDIWNSGYEIITNW